MDEELRADLLARREEDQRIRHSFAPQPGQRRVSLTTSQAAEMNRIDDANTRWLSELVAESGWPGKTLVGEDGATAAWLLAQHADPERQRMFLPLLRSAVAAGEASRTHLAYLEDRVRMRNGEPQLYGTQFVSDGQRYKPHPIEDPDNLDERRASVGLGPFADYEALMRGTDDRSG